MTSEVTCNVEEERKDGVSKTAIRLWHKRGEENENVFFSLISIISPIITACYVEPYKKSQIITTDCPATVSLYRHTAFYKRDHFNKTIQTDIFVNTIINLSRCDFCVTSLDLLIMHVNRNAAVHNGAIHDVVVKTGADSFRATLCKTNEIEDTNQIQQFTVTIFCRVI